MNVTDSIGDMLTRIRNANSALKPEVLVPYSRLKAEVAKVLKREGYIADFYAEKLENGKNSHMAAMNVQLFSDGTGNNSKDFDGLTKLIPTSPVTGTVGSVNRATFSWWRSQTTSGAKTTTIYDNLRSAMRSIAP